MRTTVDLDPKLLERLRHEAVRQRVSFRELLNSVVRRGLDSSSPASAPYKLPAFSMGAVREGIDLDKALRTAAALDEAEVVAKIERRK